MSTVPSTVGRNGATRVRSWTCGSRLCGRLRTVGANRVLTTVVGTTRRVTAVRILLPATVDRTAVVAVMRAHRAADMPPAAAVVDTPAAGITEARPGDVSLAS
jgi:hypothetical protein